jgi:hypothetical protein
MLKEATFVTANDRFPKNDIGSIGSLVRSSRKTKPASSSTPPIIEIRTVALVQPSDCARTSPNTSPNAPGRTSPKPGKSSVP